MQVTVDKKELISFLQEMVISCLSDAYKVDDATHASVFNIEAGLRAKKVNPYGELIFVPEQLLTSSIANFDLSIFESIEEMKWDQSENSWIALTGNQLHLKGPGRFLESITGLQSLKALRFGEVKNWVLNSKMLHEDQVSSSLRPAQKLAARKVISNYSFIWGPPGTGKTFTSATILQSLLNNDCKVLVTSTANKAVDEIMDQLIEINPACDNRIARYGGDRIEKGKRFRIPELQKQKLRSRNPKDEAALIEKELSEATVIFANTMAVQCYPKFKQMAFKYVLLDETSMIPAYMVETLRSLYPEAKFIFAGDPMQLPPVIKDDNLAQRRYARNVYDYPEIQDQLKLFLNGQNSIISFLDVQSRMHSRLGSAISKAFYYGKLNSSKPAAKKLVWPDRGIDASNEVYASGELTIMGHKALKVSGLPNTKVLKNANLLEATWIAEGASWIKKNYSNYKVMIITPFVNQVALIRSLLGRNDIDVTTVHKAQGSQADIVLFSLAGSQNRNYYVDKCPDHVSEKLINVAISRTKVQCIVVGSARHLVKLNPLTKLQRAYVGAPVEVAIEAEVPQLQPVEAQPNLVEIPKPQVDLKTNQVAESKVSEVNQMKLRIEALEAENLRLKEEVRLLRGKSNSYSLKELSTKPFFVKRNEEF